MTTFLISYSDTTSEWLNNFNEVQVEMNNLEKQGVISNVKVQQFIDNVLSQEFIYNYNGEQWEK